jgi:hypothetical protein
VDNDTVIGAVSNNNLKLITQNTERMRIDSSGNLLVGNTVVNPVSGFGSIKGFGYAASTGKVEIATDANASVMELGKNNANDGSILVFRKQGTSVGSIGTFGGTTYFASNSHGFLINGTQIEPSNNSGGRLDNTVDIGSSSYKFKDLYLSGGVNLGDTNRNLKYRSANNDILLESASGLFYRQDIGNTTHSWFTGNSERMRIQSNGRTALFQTTGDGALTIRGEGGSSFIAISFTHNSNAGVGYIQTSASSVDYSTSSDYRLKENVVPMENGLERIQKLKPVKFNWKLDGEESEGFLAHEVQEAGWDDGVTGSKDDNLIEEGQQTYQGMDYGRITPLLVKAMQEQQTIIDDLKTRIETLENV